MQIRLTRVTPLQAAKVSAALYFVLSIPLILLMILVSLASPAPHPPVFLYVLLPFLYALFGFIFSALGAWLYNLVARQLGGLEFEITEQHGL